MKTIGGDSSEIGSATKKEGKNRRPVSVLTSPQTSGIKRRATTSTYGNMELIMEAQLFVWPFQSTTWKSRKYFILKRGNYGNTGILYFVT